ncbi:MAG: winged helix-turn-helix transcriptional regulator [Acidobacteria bacterium]|nr:winged helix-turn-helix transcriptional regulator [Acidobacteriota bacterium]
MTDIEPRNSCSDRLKVLAEEKRLQVIRLLLEGPKHVGELQQQVDVEQSLLSHHLRVLREAGLVTAERDGKAVLYRVAPDVSVRQPGEAINLGCCVLDFGDREGKEDEPT